MDEINLDAKAEVIRVAGSAVKFARDFGTTSTGISYVIHNYRPLPRHVVEAFKKAFGEEKAKKLLRVK